MSARGIIAGAFFIALLMVSAIGWFAVDFSVSTARLLGATDDMPITLSVIWGAAAVVLIAVGLFLDRYFVRPLIALREMANSVGAGRLNTRVREAGESEIADLQHAFNRMAERLESREAELRDSESWFRSLYDNSPDAIVAFDIETLRFEEINNKAVDLFGYPREAFLDLGLLDLSDEPEASKKAVSELAAGKLSGSLRRRFRRKDGSCFVAEVYPGIIASGGRDKCVAVVHDVTKREEAARTLRESEEKYRALMEAAADPIILFDPSGAVVDVNERVVETSGYDRDELLTKTYRDFVIPGMEREADEVFDAILNSDGLIVSDFPTVNGRGERVHFNLAGARVEYGGRVVVQIILHDISELRRAREDLAAIKEHLESVLEATAEGIYAISTDGRCIFANPACLRILGYDKGEFVGERVHDLIHHTKPDGTPYPQSECRVCDAFRHNRPVHEAHEVFWRKDGTALLVEYTCLPLIRNAEVVGAVVSFADITQRVETERALRYAQKVDALGNLAGGIAHNLNNLLLPILSLTGMTIRELPDDSRGRARLERVVEAAERAKGIVSQILSFSRHSGSSAHLEPVDLTDVTRSALDLALVGVPSSVDVIEEIDTLDASVMGDREQLTMVVMNLVSNASDAFAGKVGRLSLTLKAVDVDEKMAASIQGLKPGRYAMFRVSDTGKGMDEATLARIFDPFFTTKEVGQGAGLGLSVVHGIVDRHGGAIAVDSAPAKGTTVTVWLPLAEPGVDAPETP